VPGLVVPFLCTLLRNQTLKWLPWNSCPLTSKQFRPEGTQRLRGRPLLSVGSMDRAVSLRTGCSILSLSKCCTNFAEPPAVCEGLTYGFLTLPGGSEVVWSQPYSLLSCWMWNQWVFLATVLAANIRSWARWDDLASDPGWAVSISLTFRNVPYLRSMWISSIDKPEIWDWLTIIYTLLLLLLLPFFFFSYICYNILHSTGHVILLSF
jgi:hypothetical protein